MEHPDREKHVQIMNELKSKLAESQVNLVIGQAIVKTLKKEKEILTTKLKEVESKAQIFYTLEKKQKETLKDTLYPKDKIREDLFGFKDKLVDTYDSYFKRVKEHATFLYLELDLRQMRFFKVVCDN